MTLRGILLDKDGTLIDFDATWGPAAYRAMGVLAEGDRGRLEALMRVSQFVETERRFLPTSPLVAGSSAHYGPLWAEALGRPATDGFFGEMDELFRVFGLDALAPIGNPAAVAAELTGRGLKVGIATNDAERSGRDQAEALGLIPYAPFIVGYDSGFGPKPHPGMVLGFAAYCGCSPSEVALVGDSLHDLHAAEAAGALAVLVLTGPLGRAARDQLAPHADHVIETIADLPSLADELLAGDSIGRAVWQAGPIARES
jgi:phosphoglycolate phosphatase